MFEDFVRKRITELRMRKNISERMYESRYGTFGRIYKSYIIRKSNAVHERIF